MTAEVQAPQGIETKTKVFISYSRKDIGFANRLEAALKTRGFDPLIDRSDIYAFEDWWKRIEALIARSDLIVFVLSPDAVTSDVALKEVAYAASLNKRFAPIVCRRVEDSTVPEPLRRLNFIFFDDPSRFEASADQLAEALQTDVAWIRLHTEYGEAGRRWSAAGRPGGLLLRSPALEQAEHWIASRPGSAPTPTKETQAFITESRRSATRRRNLLTGTLGAGLLLALALAGLAYWQRGIAVQERELAVQNAEEAKAQKSRADESAEEARRNADEARGQRDIAERQTQEATRQAARSDARAELIQSQLLTKAAPREALSRAYQAAQKLDDLGAGDEAVSFLGNVLNSARELPLRRPYPNYILADGTVFVRQSSTSGLTTALIAGRPATKPLTVVGTLDITGIIDEDGRAVGRPIGGPEFDRSYTNDAAWLDDEHFVLATGAWEKANEQSNEFRIFNPALRLYNADGTLAEEYLARHFAPVTSVAVLGDKEARTILAGDALGNLLVKPIGEEVQIIATGVSAPIKRIIVDQPNVVLVFGRLDPDSTPKLSERKDLNISEQQEEIASALKFPVRLSYLGGKPTDDLGCAIIVGHQLYVCNSDTIEFWLFNSDGNLEINPWRSFTAHATKVVAIASSPISPIIATGSRDGQIRLWLKDGTLLAELSPNQLSIGAFGFIHNGQQLLSSSSTGLQLWNIQDLAGQLRIRTTGSDQNWSTDRMKRRNWVRFVEDVDVDVDRLSSLIKDSGAQATDYRNHGRFLIAARPSLLHVIDTQNMTMHDVRLGKSEPDRADEDTDLSFQSEIANRGGDLICVLRGFHGIKNAPDSRQIYAVNGKTGAVLAEWPLPADFQKKFSVVSLASHNVDGQTQCWVWDDEFVFVFSLQDESPRGLKILDPKDGRINRIVPLDNSDLFVISAESDSGSSIVALAHSTPKAAPNSVADNAVIDALTRIEGRVDKIAISSDGSRIAVSVASGPAVAEVRLFDRHLNVISKLPGSPWPFDVINFNSDGSAMRALSAGLDYEQDLRLQSQLKEARNRIDAWTEDDDRADAFAKATKENDQEKSKILLTEAVQGHPSDFGLVMLLANREFNTSKGFADRLRAMQLYDKANLLDPFEPTSHYMRGRAWALVGNNEDAVEDLSAAIELPHFVGAAPRPVPVRVLGIRKCRRYIREVRAIRYRKEISRHRTSNVLHSP